MGALIKEDRLEDEELPEEAPDEEGIEACLIVCSFCSISTALGLLVFSLVSTEVEDALLTTSLVTLTRFFRLASHFSARRSMESWILSVELDSLEGRENLGRLEAAPDWLLLLLLLPPRLLLAKKRWAEGGIELLEEDEALAREDVEAEDEFEEELFDKIIVGILPGEEFELELLPGGRSLDSGRPDGLISDEDAEELGEEVFEVADDEVTNAAA